MRRSLFLTIFAVTSVVAVAGCEWDSSSYDENVINGGFIYCPGKVVEKVECLDNDEIKGIELSPGVVCSIDYNYAEYNPDPKDDSNSSVIKYLSSVKGVLCVKDSGKYKDIYEEIGKCVIYNTKDDGNAPYKIGSSCDEKYRDYINDYVTCRNLKQEWYKIKRYLSENSTIAEQMCTSDKPYCVFDANGFECKKISEYDPTEECANKDIYTDEKSCGGCMDDKAGNKGHECGLLFSNNKEHGIAICLYGQCKTMCEKNYTPSEQGSSGGSILSIGCTFNGCEPNCKDNESCVNGTCISNCESECAPDQTCSQVGDDNWQCVSRCESECTSGQKCSNMGDSWQCVEQCKPACDEGQTCVYSELNDINNYVCLANDMCAGKCVPGVSYCDVVNDASVPDDQQDTEKQYQCVDYDKCSAYCEKTDYGCLTEEIKMNDIHNCGGCGLDCGEIYTNAEVSCVGGVCQVTCNEGYYKDVESGNDGDKIVCKPYGSDEHCNVDLDCTNLDNAKEEYLGWGEAYCYQDGNDFKNNQCRMKACADDYHLYGDKCEADTVDNCGVHDYKCTTVSFQNSTLVECVNKHCEAVACDPGYFVVSGSCVEKHCKPDVDKCVEDENGGHIIKCSSDGENWVDGASCDGKSCKGEQSCGDCKNGAITCNNDASGMGQLSTCANGTEYSNVASCGAVSCNEEGNGCGECLNGAVKCEGSSTYTCIKGKWSDETACTTTDTYATPVCKSNTDCGYTCKTNYTDNGAKCCKNVTNGFIKVNKASTCSYGCNSGYSSNGKLCCKNIANGSIKIDNGSSCAFACLTGYSTNGKKCCEDVLNGTIVEDKKDTCSFDCNSGYCKVDGACVSNQNDMNNCGSCGNKCTIAAGSFASKMSCVAGKCEIAECQPDYELKDGACVKTNCTAGALKCEGTKHYQCKDNAWVLIVDCEEGKPTSSTASCDSTKGCKYSCPSGTPTVCSNACVNILANNTHCGKCNTACNKSKVTNSAAATCTNGKCIATKCATGFDLVDGACVKHTCTDGDFLCEDNKLKQCYKNAWHETLDCNALAPKDATVSCDNTTGCGYACPADKPAVCGNACVNIISDANNCGGCGNVCDGTIVPNSTSTGCSHGLCVATRCADDYELKDGACVEKGCAEDETSNGAICCKEVSNGEITVDNNASACSFTCNSNYHKNAAGTGCEINSITDCGSSHTVCPTATNGSAQCSTAGECSYDCNDTSYPNLCTDTCVNFSNDVHNCGSCGNGCPTPSNGTATCSSGACGFTCNDDYCKSGSSCVSKQTDVNNCGSCGSKCTVPNALGVQCSAGVCEATSCKEGFKLEAGKCVK